MAFLCCPKCGKKINYAVECNMCGRMPTPEWPWRHPPPRGYLAKLKKAKKKAELNGEKRLAA